MFAAKAACMLGHDKKIVGAGLPANPASDLRLWNIRGQGRSYRAGVSIRSCGNRRVRDYRFAGFPGTSLIVSWMGRSDFSRLTASPER